MKRLIWWPRIILASILLLLIIIITEAPFRSIVAFWFLMVCPGMAFVRLLHIEDILTELTLAIALSITINTIVSEIMVLARIWSPNGALVSLIGLSITGVVFQIIDANGRRSDTQR